MRNTFSKVCFVGILALAVSLVGTGNPRASTVQKQNVVDLIDLAEYIIVGRVVSVTDGIVQGIPYTEVTVEVGEAIRGEPGASYTFRQFGLMSPREMPNGTTNISLTPDGWATYAENEEVVLFLYYEGELTGLRTTVGLFQGKFDVTNGMVLNEVQNLGLFDGVEAELGLLTEKEQSMIEQPMGAISAETFIPFVSRAVEEQWVEEGRLSHAE